MQISQHQPNRAGKKVENYVFTKLLGKGAFGEVYQASHTGSQDIVAIKCVTKIKQAEHQGLVGRMLKTEIEVLERVRNPNVVSLKAWFESQNQTYIVLEFCNQGDFEDKWKKNNHRFPEQEALSYFKQILNGMKGLHELNVIHRDLKLANLLMHNNVLKICDLGFATKLENKDQKVNICLGSLGNMAPEVVENKLYGIQADMFSLGSIYYQLLFGQFPYSVKSHQDFLQSIKTTKLNFNHLGVRISAQSQDLLTRMLEYDPAKRIKWSQLYSHEILSDKGVGGYQNLSINSLVAKNVNVKENGEMYRRNEQKLQNVNQDNMQQQWNDNQRDQAMRKIQIVDEPSPTPGHSITTQFNDDREDVELLQAIQQIQEQQLTVMNEVNVVIERYIQLRNKSIYLARTFESLQTLLTELSDQALLACIYLIKKIIFENRALAVDIAQNKNIFETPYMKEVYQSEAFENFYKILNDEIMTYEYQLEGLNYQAKEQKWRPQTNIKNYSFDSKYGPDFNLQYKEVILNYYFDLSHQTHQLTQLDRRQKSLLILLHLIDCYLYDTEFHKNLAKPNFSFDTYFEENNQKTINQLDQLVNSRCELLFQ